MTSDERHEHHGTSAAQAGDVAASAWIGNTYFPALTAKLTASLDYLNGAVTWALSVVTVGIGAVTAADGFPNRKSIVFICALFVLLAHFAVRCAKGYLNVIRYSLLDREITRLLLHEDVDDVALTRVTNLIDVYDARWLSPLTRSDLAWKIVRDFGFGYMFLFLAGALAYVEASTDRTWWSYALPVGTALAVALEVGVGLFRSPYVRDIQVHDDARRLR